MFITIGFHTNNYLEKYAFSNAAQDSFPGLKPLSNWPVSLDDLLTRLSECALDELFHQPFDVNGNFHRDAMTYIRKNYKLFKELDNEESALYEGYLTKSIQAFLTVKILEGNLVRLLEAFEMLQEFYTTDKEVFNEIFRKAVNLPFEQTGKNVLKDKIDLLINHHQLSEVYPIMRNYTIYDFFNATKNILFATSRYNYNACTSITSDSKYLYIILSGINGGMLKIGTGFQDTIKGKVYLFERMTTSEEVSCNWVYLKGKLYMKTVNASSTTSDAGSLLIIDPETFRKEGKTRLFLPESVKHPALRRKNDNYVLLTDGENLNILILEPVLKDSSSPAGDSKDQSDDEANTDKQVLKDVPLKKMKGTKESVSTVPSDVFTFINLVLYTYPIKSDESSFQGKIQNNFLEGEERNDMINEVFDSFSYIFSKEECKKALILNNWHIEVNSPKLILENCGLSNRTRGRNKTTPYDPGEDLSTFPNKDRINCD